VNNHIIPSTHGERKITDLSNKHSFIPYPSLCPYSRTDRMTDRGTKHSLRVGWRNFFPVVPLCQFIFLLRREIVLGVTYLPYQFCRCVWLHRSVFWLWWEKDLGVTYLPTIPVVPLCQFLVLAGNSFWLHSF
jgi:hypothetical protein